jgi:hypothetical protein
MEIVLSGWFWTSIVAPLLLPLIGLMPLKLLPLGAAVAPNLRFMAVVKDAQLCWGAVAMGASSFYEFWHFISNKTSNPGIGVLTPDIAILLGFLLSLIFLMTLMAMILAAGGSVFSTPLLPAPAGGIWAWCKYYKAFVGSVGLCLLSAIGFTIIHVKVGG